MSIIIALLVFSVLIIVHEWGHFIAARKCDVPVEEFSIGMGPAIYQKQGKKTLFSIRILPIGGYCKMTGEEEKSDDVNAFCNKNVWQKILIVVAGATMNIVYAFVLILIIANCAKVSTRKIDSVAENSPAAIAGMEVGDVLMGVNGKEYKLIDDITFEVALNASGKETFEFAVNRKGKKIYVPVDVMRIIQITDMEDVESEKILEGDRIYEINGVSIREISNIKDELAKEKVVIKKISSDEEIELTEEEVKVVKKNLGNLTSFIGVTLESDKLNVLESIPYAFRKTCYYVSSTYKGLKMMITGKVYKEQVSGPVGIIKSLGDTYNEGKESGFKIALLSILSLSAMISVNLGVINLLPLPALDGGRFFILLIEVVRRKPMDLDKESWIHFVGFILLMILMVVILFNDVAKIFGW